MEGGGRADRGGKGEGRKRWAREAEELSVRRGSVRGRRKRGLG